MIKVFRSVYVAYWDGESVYSTGTEVSAAQNLNLNSQGDLLVPVAVYEVEIEDISEITLDGPQLMVRGQPVACKRLTIVKP